MNEQKSVDWKKRKFLRMWPRALFHMKEGKPVLKTNLNEPGVYVLYRDDRPYYIGKTGAPLIQRLSTHALKPNSPRYNFWNFFSAFEIADSDRRDEIEAIRISAMPTANNSRPKFVRKKLDRNAARLLNNVQAQMLTGKEDRSGVPDPESSDEEEDDSSVFQNR